MRIEERTIADITRDWPAADAVLQAYGLDACCGGERTLRDAAEVHALPVEELLAALRVAGVQDTSAAEQPVVDVRALAPRDRHPRIFATFDGLPVGGALTLVNDHDPKPLFYQFQAERPGQVRWEPQEEGPERWVIRINRVA